MIGFKYDDGGRAAAGYKGEAGDCIVRAVAIAAELDYETVYKALKKFVGATPRDGVMRKDFEPFVLKMGFRWKPTMQVGTGCTVHLNAEELPSGRIICKVSKHLCAVIDGVVYDTFDPSRDGTRCVYGIYYKPKE
jgi:hypothetical protein